MFSLPRDRVPHLPLNLTVPTFHPTDARDLGRLLQLLQLQNVVAVIRTPLLQRAVLRVIVGR